MYISLLGRQPALSLAEIERTLGVPMRFSESTATFETNKVVDIEKLGGSQKIGKVSLNIPSTNWSQISKFITEHYYREWSSRSGKLTVGLSVYDATINPRDIQKIGLTLKGRLKGRGVNIRLIPNQEATLSTATSHHNKLGLADNKIELIIAIGSKNTIVAESTGSQNITALASRDQGRPKRDAFVGMLPPKLAQIMINLASAGESKLNLLDPFCGTGVLLQEALLIGHSVYGTDLSEKMISYSEQNLEWLSTKNKLSGNWTLHEGDAMTTQWQKLAPQTIASEAYLGQPFSAPPSAKKLEEVQGNCQHIISSFLKNLHSQVAPGTEMCIAVPAWKNSEGSFSHLPLVSSVEKFGYERIILKSVKHDDLIYYRPDQVVARELLLIKSR